MVKLGWGGVVMEHVWADVVAKAAPILQSVGAAATSWLAWRIYAALAAMVIGGGSILFALRQRAKILELVPFRGRKPRKLEAIDRRIEHVQKFKANQTRVLLSRMLLVVAFGFVIPSTLLLLGIHYYSWFKVGEAPLQITMGCRTWSIHPSLEAAAQFVLSQFAMGASASHVVGSLAASTPWLSRGTTYAPNDGVVSTAVILYRYFIGICATLLVQLSRAAYVARTTKFNVEDELLRARARAVSQKQ